MINRIPSDDQAEAQVLALIFVFSLLFDCCVNIQILEKLGIVSKTAIWRREI